MGAALSQPELLDRSETTLGSDTDSLLLLLLLFTDRSETIARTGHRQSSSSSSSAATLRVHHFPPKPCSPSVCDHFVRDSARISLPLTVTVQHRLLPCANVSRMYAECFDKVLYHVNSRILKCKMANVITRRKTMYLMHIYKSKFSFIILKASRSSKYCLQLIILLWGEHEVEWV